MPLSSLDDLSGVRYALSSLRREWLRWVVGVEIGIDVSISLTSQILPAERGAVTIGDHTLIAFKTLIYTCDDETSENRPVRIGSRCFIGGGSIVTPGVRIGDGSIVGAGSVVTSDVEAGTIVAGCPARVLKRGIQVGRFGFLTT